MESPSFIFSSGNLELKSEGENFFVEGYISTSDLDLVNDIVTKACLMDMAEQMRSRTIKLDIEHESFRGKSSMETEINKTIIPAAKIEDFLIDKKGLKVRAMLNRHIPRFNEVKNSIEDGFIDAFSIAFVPVKETIQEKGGQKIRMLDQINLLNVAFTGNPVNTSATIENVFLKSLEFLEEQKAKPKKPKPQPDPHKEPEDEDEDEDEEEKGCKKPKKKNHDHLSDNPIKLQEVKNMSEEEKEKEEAQKKAEEEAKEKEDEEKEKAEVKAKEEAEAKAEEEEKEKEEAEESKKEVKSLKDKIESMEKDMTEMKALLKMPVRKSKVEPQDKSENFKEEKTQNPLDLIA